MISPSVSQIHGNAWVDCFSLKKPEIWRCHLTSLISTMEYPILVRCHLYIESGPRVLLPYRISQRNKSEIQIARKLVLHEFDCRCWACSQRSVLFPRCEKLQKRANDKHVLYKTHYAIFPEYKIFEEIFYIITSPRVLYVTDDITIVYTK